MLWWQCAHSISAVRPINYCAVSVLCRFGVMPFRCCAVSLLCRFGVVLCCAVVFCSGKGRFAGQCGQQGEGARSRRVREVRKRHNKKNMCYRSVAAAFVRVRVFLVSCFGVSCVHWCVYFVCRVCVCMSLLRVLISLCVRSRAPFAL